MQEAVFYEKRINVLRTEAARSSSAAPSSSQSGIACLVDVGCGEPSNDGVGVSSNMSAYLIHRDVKQSVHTPVSINGRGSWRPRRDRDGTDGVAPPSRSSSKNNAGGVASFIDVLLEPSRRYYR